MSDFPTIGDCMKRNVISIHASASLRDAGHLIIYHKIGTLPVLDDNDQLIGIITVQDIIHLFLPDFVSLVRDIDFVKDFGALKTPSEEVLHRADQLTVRSIMSEPFAVEENSSLIKSMSVMEKHQLWDLPVVSGGQLVGIASRVDIGRAFLMAWLEEIEEGPTS